MAAIHHAKQQKQQQDIQNQYTQALTQETRANQQRTQTQDALANRKAGIGVAYPQQFAPPQNADPLTSAKAYLHMADYYDQQGATDLAKQYRDNAAAIIGAYYGQARIGATNATTGLTQAKTVTEKQRPGLVKAQTEYTKAGVPLRNAQTKRITTIQPQQFEEQQRNALRRVQMQIEDRQARTLQAIGAALDRMHDRENFEDQERQKREGFSTSQTRQRNAHAANVERMKAQAVLLRSQVEKLLAKKDKNGNPKSAEPRPTARCFPARRIFGRRH